jgi:DNA-binding NtrC family response regulator
LASAGEFSAALAGQLSTITIELPALAERKEDLPLLAQSFLEEVNARGGKQVAGFTGEALDLLCEYSWPENLDELSAVVRQAHERSQGAEVAARNLGETIHCSAGAKVHPPRVDETIVLGEFLASVEKELIARALKRAKGNKTKAAKLLGLTRPRLYRRLVQLGMEPPDFQEA